MSYKIAINIDCINNLVFNCLNNSTFHKKIVKICLARLIKDNNSKVNIIHRKIFEYINDKNDRLSYIKTINNFNKFVIKIHKRINIFIHRTFVLHC